MPALPNSPPHPSRSGRQARWWLLATSQIMGLLLVGSSVSSWRAAERHANVLAKSQGEEVFNAFREAVPPDRGGPPGDSDLEAFLEGHREEGLHYVALIHSDGSLAGSAGEPPVFDPVEGMSAGEGRFFVYQRDRVGMLAQPPEGPPHRDHQPPSIYIEFEPLLARELVEHAGRNLALGVAGAALLALAAGVFWRLSLRADAAEERLEEQRKLAALGEMSAVLAHEIRNPLASLKGHAQLLAGQLAEGSRERKKAERVVAESVRLEKLTNELLDFVRAGTISAAPADPAALLLGSAEAVGAERIELRAERAPATWSMDPLRMQQVLVNLLENALQASPEGGTVEAGVQATPDGLEFRVRDRGEGLPEGAIARIFEPFHTTRTRGTGLGLAVSKRIVELQQGRIEARNHPEGGAEFRVILPPA